MFRLSLCMKLIFNFRHIIPYLKKNGVNPCTGKKLSSKELIHLKFDKDEQGKPKHSLISPKQVRYKLRLRVPYISLTLGLGKVLLEFLDVRNRLKI